MTELPFRNVSTVPPHDIFPRLKSNFPQHYDHLKPGQEGKFPIQKRTALTQFLRKGLVIRGCAVGGGSDPDVTQSQPVISRPAFRLAGKTGAMQGAVQIIAGTVAGKGPAGSVGPMRPRRQTHNQHPRRGISERGHRLSPIRLVLVSPAFGDRHFANVAVEARASPTAHNFPVQDRQSPIGVLFHNR